MKSWLHRLFGGRTPDRVMEAAPPSLLKAIAFADDDIGAAQWNTEHNSDFLSVTNDGQTIEWEPLRRSGGQFHPVWVPASTCLHLHSGHFRWDFIVDEMASRQIG